MKSVTESLVMKLFDKWKNKQLGKTAKKMMKDNPQLEKDMKTISLEHLHFEVRQSTLR